MNRRRFLASLGAAIAGATLDPEKLLWRPGAKLISIPRPSPIYVSYWLDYHQQLAQMRESWSVYDARAGAMHFNDVYFGPGARVFYGDNEIPASVRADLGARLGVDPDRLALRPKIGAGITLERPKRFYGDSAQKVQLKVAAGEMKKVEYYMRQDWDA